MPTKCQYTKEILELRKKTVEEYFTGNFEKYKEPILEIISNDNIFGKNMKTKTLVMGALLYFLTEKKGVKIRHAIHRLPPGAMEYREDVWHPYRPYMNAWRVIKEANKNDLPILVSSEKNK